MKDRTKRVLKGATLNVLVVLAIVVGVLAIAGTLILLKHGSCGRLDADRVSHLQPGHDVPGPDSIYVKGIGTDTSELMQYLEAEAAMARAGC